MTKREKAGEAVILNLRIVPDSSKNEIVGKFNGSIKIKIAAPPVDGAANAGLIAFLAKKLCIAKSEIEIISGHNSKNKQVKIYNSDAKTLAEILKIDF